MTGLALQHPEVCFLNGRKLDQFASFVVEVVGLKHPATLPMDFLCNKGFGSCLLVRWVASYLQPTNHQNSAARSFGRSGASSGGTDSSSCREAWNGLDLAFQCGLFESWLHPIFAQIENAHFTKPKALEYVGCFWNLQVFDAKNGGVSVDHNSWPQWKWMEMVGSVDGLATQSAFNCEVRAFLKLDQSRRNIPSFLL